MAYRRNSIDENKIARFYKEGRGLGRGADYQPWLTIWMSLPKGARIASLAKNLANPSFTVGHRVTTFPTSGLV